MFSTRISEPLVLSEVDGIQCLELSSHALIMIGGKHWGLKTTVREEKRSAHEIEQVKFQNYEHIILVCGGIKTYM